MKKLAALLLTLIGVIVLYGCCKTDTKNDVAEPAGNVNIKPFGAYSFSGKNEYFRITNGSIVYGDQNESFKGGTLEILQPDLFTNVHSYSTTFYTLLNNGQRNAFHSTTATGVTGGAEAIRSNLGSSSSNGFMILNLAQGLWFELITTDVTGTENVYLLELAVAEDVP